jgi:hypothetical protein
LSLSQNFFKYVVSNATPELAEYVLQPLLHSVVTFRFRESVFTRFIRTLIIDVGQNGLTAQDGRLPTYVGFLVDSIVTSIPLLPEPVLELFRLIEARQWSREQLFQLFFSQFLWRTGMLWISHFCGTAYTTTLRIVLEAISPDSRAANSVFEQLFTARSIFSVPMIYRWFGHLCLEFLVAVRDIHLAAQVLHSARRLPATVTVAELKRIPPGRDCCLYYVQVYPKRDGRRPLPAFQMTPLFGDMGESELLERLFVTRLHQSSVADWLNVIAALQDIIVSPLISEVVGRPIPSFEEGYQNYTVAFGISRINRRVYLAMLETQLQEWLSPEVRRVLVAAEIEFVRITAAVNAAEGLAFQQLTVSLPPGARKILVDALRQLAWIGAALLHEKFRILLSAMDLLKIVQRKADRPNCVNTIILHHNRGKEFLSTFVLLDVFAMKNPPFAQMCNDEEKHLWCMLETAILTILRNEGGFLESYMGLRDELIAIATEKLDYR